ncbi:MAG: hypothetical protein ACOX05_07050 [Bacillota bacterium]
MSKEISPKIMSAVKQAAVDEKISCAKLMNLADKLGCSYAEIGEAANQLKIKVYHCQLGCF